MKTLRRFVGLLLFSAAVGVFGGAVLLVLLSLIQGRRLALDAGFLIGGGLFGAAYFCVTAAAKWAVLGTKWIGQATYGRPRKLTRKE
jgi:hypothetical protein